MRAIVFIFLIGVIPLLGCKKIISKLVRETTEEVAETAATKLLREASEEATEQASKKIMMEVSEETGELSTKKLTQEIASKRGGELLERARKMYSPALRKAIGDDDVLSMFAKTGYKETKAVISGKEAPLLISPKFDPYLTTPKGFYGDYDVVARHKGNPLFVRNGGETNLGKMKRGLAPLYINNNIKNTQKGMGHYYPFELHHGGQKRSPDYWALMAEEHKTHSKILHPKRVGSEIDRNHFAKKERTRLYKELAEKYLAEGSF